MARNMEGLFNHLRHALCRPQFCAVAMGHGTLKQDSDQATLLPFGQSPRTTRRESHAEGILAASSPRIPPSHDRTGGATDAPSYLVQGPFLAKQFQCTPASI
ncbi:MAG: hypothetical protein WB780_18855 [Candidatus Acidiferrales bacterium]